MLTVTLHHEPGCSETLISVYIGALLYEGVLGENIQSVLKQLCPPLTLQSVLGYNISSKPCFINPSASPKTRPVTQSLAYPLVLCTNGIIVFSSFILVHKCTAEYFL